MQNTGQWLVLIFCVLVIIQGFPRGASKILDHLYIGGEDAATNINLLKELKITHVVNCVTGYTKTGQNFYGKIKYMGFAAEDDDDYNIFQHFDDVYRFIEEARKSGGKALVHCIMGVNRSGALCVGYTMIYKNMGPISAVEFVKKARGCLLSNENFQRQLVTLARKRGYLVNDKNYLKSK